MHQLNFNVQLKKISNTIPTSEESETLGEVEEEPNLIESNDQDKLEEDDGMTRQKKKVVKEKKQLNNGSSKMGTGKKIPTEKKIKKKRNIWREEISTNRYNSIIRNCFGYSGKPRIETQTVNTFNLCMKRRNFGFSIVFSFVFVGLQRRETTGFKGRKENSEGERQEGPGQE